MKHLSKIVALGAVFAVSVSSAFAATIQLGSYAGGTNSGVYPVNPGNPGVTNTAMSYVGFTAATTFAPPGVPGTTAPVTAPTSNLSKVQSTYFLDPESGSGVWDAALPNSAWVGIAQTAGPQGTGISTANNPAQGFYTFTTTFSATGVYNLSLSVFADDTTEVFLNNTTTPIIGFGNLGGDSHCADTAPTCLNTVDTINLSGLSLTGTNTLYFVIEQGGNESAVDPSGVDFNATLSQAPEPNSLILLGSGLFGAAGMLVRKRRTV